MGLMVQRCGGGKVESRTTIVAQVRAGQRLDVKGTIRCWLDKHAKDEWQRLRVVGVWKTRGVVINEWGVLMDEWNIEVRLSRRPRLFTLRDIPDSLAARLLRKFQAVRVS